MHNHASGPTLARPTPVIALQQPPSPRQRRRAPASRQGSRAPPATPAGSCSASSPATRLRLATAQARSEGYDPIDADALARCDVAFLALPHGESRELGEAAARRPARPSSTSGRTSASTRLGLRPAGAVPRRDRRPPACRQPRLLRDGRDARARAAGRGRACRRPRRDRRQVRRLGRRPHADRAHPPAARSTAASSPYSATGHRHIAEIEQAARGRLAGGERARHLHAAPAPPRARPRGDRATCGCASRSSQDDARGALRRALRRRAVRARRQARPRRQRLPARTSATSASGVDERTGTAIVAARIDNLVKGAAGQAIQNANLMLGPATRRPG